MRIYHLADLHLGKSVYGLPMLADQRHFVEEFLKICQQRQPDAVLIAGDVYDRSAPSGDAVELLDFLLTKLVEQNIPVLLISGNHDSGQRLSFGQAMFADKHLHIAGKVSEELKKVTLKDEYGAVDFYLLPYTYPEQLSVVLNEPLRNYDQAMRCYLGKQQIDNERRNVLIAHQNVVNNGKESERGGSETMVGGVGMIEACAFDMFDYVALGHIHAAYPVAKETIRYAGTPLCYHLNETRQQIKGFTEVILKRKGETPQITQIGITPLHQMRYLKGSRDEIYDLLKEDKGRNEYVGITITDQRISQEIADYLRSLLSTRGSVLIELLSSYQEQHSGSKGRDIDDIREEPIEELFARFYQEQFGDVAPDEKEYAYMCALGEMLRNTSDKNDVDDNAVAQALKKLNEVLR